MSFIEFQNHEEYSKYLTRMDFLRGVYNNSGDQESTLKSITSAVISPDERMHSAYKAGVSQQEFVINLLKQFLG